MKFDHFTTKHPTEILITKLALIKRTRCNVMIRLIWYKSSIFGKSAISYKTLMVFSIMCKILKFGLGQQCIILHIIISHIITLLFITSLIIALHHKHVALHQISSLIIISQIPALHNLKFNLMRAPQMTIYSTTFFLMDATKNNVYL